MRAMNIAIMGVLALAVVITINTAVLTGTSAAETLAKVLLPLGIVIVTIVGLFTFGKGKK